MTFWTTAARQAINYWADLEKKQKFEKTDFCKKKLLGFKYIFQQKKVFSANTLNWHEFMLLVKLLTFKSKLFKLQNAKKVQNSFL